MLLFLFLFGFADALLVVVPGFVAFAWACVVYCFWPSCDGSFEGSAVVAHFYIEPLVLVKFN
jgi:hypothetical protein